MQHNLHHGQAVQAGSHIIDHDAHALRQAFQLAHRWRFDDIERSEKYKAQQQRLPCDRRRNQSDKLTSDFVDHHKLRIFTATCPRHPRSRRDSSQNGGQREQRRSPGLPARRDLVREKPP